LILVRLKLKLQRDGGIRSSIDSIKLAGEQLKASFGSFALTDAFVELRYCSKSRIS
jgi:hypothetical protein